MKRVFSTVLILVFALFTVIAQDFGINQNDLSNVKVDELSNSQISELMKRAEESGMTESQIQSALVARGFPQSEILKLQKRIESLGSTESAFETISRTRNDIQSNNNDIFSTLKTPAETGAKSNYEIFGTDLFSNQNLTFEPSINIPTPQNYVLGAGDQLIIDVWGASQQNYQLTISPEGSIYIENLGPIRVSGQTINEASKRIISRLQAIYSGLIGPARNTYAQVTLGNTRTIQIHMVGELQIPGTYTLSSFATVFNAIYSAGGPGEKGSLRNIELFRNNERIQTIDIYQFLIEGKQDNNAQLQDQDIIKVNPYNSRIGLTGEIKRPGIYEIQNEEMLGDLLSFSGGFNEDAYKKFISIYRSTETEQELLTLPFDEFEGFELMNGDSIVVGKILNRFTNRVTINGAVHRPGEYSINDKLSLKSLIDMAEGIREDAYLKRGFIYRTAVDLSIEMIPFEVGKIIKGESNDIQLKKDDVISISSIFDLREEYFVDLSGEINQSGRFNFVENLTIPDLIIMGGGLKESASLYRVEVARRNKDKDPNISHNTIAEIFQFDLDEDLKVKDGDNSFILEPFDQVFIRKIPGYEKAHIVVVNGEVLYPGSYSMITKTERISDLIERAGGVTADAYLEGARLIRKVEIDEEERRKALEALMRESEDSLEFYVDESKEQAIGIDLEKIMASPGSKYDLFMENGDRLLIPKEMQTVKLTGALLYPITVRYDKKYTFNKYVSMAGGFATNAEKKKAYVIYANGTSDRTKRLLALNKYPSVEPGSEIIVPVKPERDKISAQEAIAMSSALTSMALIIVTIINTISPK